MKECPKCKIFKSLEDFGNCKSRKDGKQCYCKLCLNRKMKQDYIDNPLKYKTRDAKRIQELRAYTSSVKIERGGCKFCGEKNPVCLDFHHPNPKEKEANVAELVNWKSIDKLNIEMTKCIIMCANCHRKYHAGEL